MPLTIVGVVFKLADYTLRIKPYLTVKCGDNDHKIFKDLLQTAVKSQSLKASTVYKNFQQGFNLSAPYAGDLTIGECLIGQLVTQYVSKIRDLTENS